MSQVQAISQTRGSHVSQPSIVYDDDQLIIEIDVQDYRLVSTKDRERVSPKLNIHCKLRIFCDHFSVNMNVYDTNKAFNC